jgi:hypothetical protein
MDWNALEHMEVRIQQMAGVVSNLRSGNSWTENKQK